MASAATTRSAPRRRASGGKTKPAPNSGGKKQHAGSGSSGGRASPAPPGKAALRFGRRPPEQHPALTSTHVLLMLGAATLLYGVLALALSLFHRSGSHSRWAGGGAVAAAADGDVEALVDAGRALIQNVAFADALAVFRKAHTLAPDNVVCGLYLARMLMANKKYHEAASMFDATLSCCAPRGAEQIARARAAGNQEALQVTTDLTYGLAKSIRYASAYDFDDQREALHAELELLGAGAGDKLIAQLEAEVGEEEEAQRQTLEMERMQREFFKDEEEAEVEE